MAERSAQFKTREKNRIANEIDGHAVDSSCDAGLQPTSRRILTSSEPTISTIEARSREIARIHPQSFPKSERGWPNINPTKALQILAALDLYGRETDTVIELGDTGVNNVPHDSIKLLLSKYEDVFPADIPPGVPPIRERLGNYSIIPMPEGTVPVHQIGRAHV